MAGRRTSQIRLAAALLLATGCATTRLPPPAVVERAASAGTYSGRLRVSLRGPELRGRTAVLLAFRRPDGLRIEVPGPGGARVVAVANGGRLTAVFPSERAVFQGGATEAELERLLGVALTPAELMDLLVGRPSARVRDYEVRWGEALPRRVEATLPDGARLKASVEEAEVGVALPDAAFRDPPHDGFRVVDAEEARELWSGR